jgi:hypothetical protein
VRDCQSLPQRLTEVYNCIETCAPKAAQFRHDEARSKLRGMASDQGWKAVACPDGCAWSPIYSARFGAEGFPCCHMLCPDRLSWPRPILRAVDEIDPEHHVRIEPLQFEGLFPKSTQTGTGGGVISEAEQSERGDGVFLVELPRDCTVLSVKHLDFNRLFMLITMEWTNLLRGGINLRDGSLLQLKSTFTIHWWESAKTGRINHDSLPVPV